MLRLAGVPVQRVHVEVRASTIEVGKSLASGGPLRRRGWTQLEQVMFWAPGAVWGFVSGRFRVHPSFGCGDKTNAATIARPRCGFHWGGAPYPASIAYQRFQGQDEPSQASRTTASASDAPWRVSQSCVPVWACAPFLHVCHSPRDLLLTTQQHGPNRRGKRCPANANWIRSAGPH
eukprot:8912834-Pyramimonas_sp.AAC.1